MMLGRRYRRKMMSDINVVPYIDVMLVLLVIFMITAPMLTAGVNVNLPSADAKPLDSEDKEPLQVTVDAQGQYRMNIGGPADEVLDAEALLVRATAVLRRDPQIPVLVRGDESVPYGRVVRAMALLQRAGAPNVGLVTRPPTDREQG